MPEPFSARLRRARIKRGLRREDIAVAVRRSADAIRRWENLGKEPSYDVLIATAAVLGVPVDWLIGASDREPDWNKKPGAPDERERQILEIAESTIAEEIPPVPQEDAPVRRSHPAPGPGPRPAGGPPERQ